MVQKGLSFTLPEHVTIHQAEELLDTLSTQLTDGVETAAEGGAVTHIDACGLQILLAGVKEARVKGKNLLLHNPSEYLQHILEITGAAKIVPVRKEG